MAREVFVDSSAWFPALLRKHPDHPKVSAALRAAVNDHKRIVTTNLIVAETYVLLLRRDRRETALVFVRTVGEAPNIVVRSSQELETRALTDWLEPYHDHAFSFTDAVSFAVMADRGIEEAIALDKHFAVAGFRLTV